MRKFILLCLAIFSLAACSSIADPKTDADSLLIGRLNLNSKNQPFDYGINLNGDFKSGIEVTIRNMDTGKELSTKTSNSGMFVFPNLAAGVYQFKKFMVKVGDDRSWVTYSISPIAYRLNVEAGKVNNLGAINWISDGNLGDSLQYNVMYADVQALFAKVNEKSVWNNREWALLFLK